MKDRFTGRSLHQFIGAGHVFMHGDIFQKSRLIRGQRGRLAGEKFIEQELLNIVTGKIRQVIGIRQIF